MALKNIKPSNGDGSDAVRCRPPDGHRFGRGKELRADEVPLTDRIHVPRRTVQAVLFQASRRVIATGIVLATLAVAACVPDEGGQPVFEEATDVYLSIFNRGMAGNGRTVSGSSSAWVPPPLPKSSPEDLIRAFGTYCIDAPPDPTARDVVLRKAGYNPLPGPADAGIQSRHYVAGNNRPQIIVALMEEPFLCAAQAQLTSGESLKLGAFVKAKIPSARCGLPPQYVRPHEEFCEIPGRARTVISSHRGRTGGIGDPAVYRLTYYSYDKNAKN